MEDKYVEFEPDGMPDLADAVDVLFPGRRAHAERGENNGGRVGSRMNDDAARAGGGEAEYAREMGQRLARFLDVPAGTRDLTTHLEALTWRYPVEPVERAALRFCEALAEWRGKPELETPSCVRPATDDDADNDVVAVGRVLGGGGIANAAVRRAIGRYFVIPPKTMTTRQQRLPPMLLQRTFWSLLMGTGTGERP
ncbi:hypothetical protein BJV77DRAFT_1011520 [Russula vinacea]|nr:hypothetical protein BJV77DRAFT_1011520 [Russula vinacea]